MRGAHDARDQRHRHDEPVRGGVGARAARCATCVVKSSTLVYGAGAAGPGRGSARSTAAAAPAADRASSGALLEVEGYVRDFAEDNPHVDRVAAALLERARARHRHAAVEGARSCRSCRRIFGFDPRFQFVHEDDVVRSIAVRARPRACPASTTSPATGCCRGARSPAICGKRTVAAAARTAPGCAAAPLAPARASTCRPSCSTCCATAGASTTAGSSRPASSTATRRPARARLRRGACACGSTVGDAEPAYRYERDVENFFRHSPAVVRDDESDADEPLDVSRRPRRASPTASPIVTLDDPDRRNALNLDDGRRDRRRLRRASRPTTTSARWSSPARRRRSAPAPTSSHLGRRPARRACAPIYEGFLRVGRSPLPTLAAVNGAAVGAGMNLALVVRRAARRPRRARFDTRFLSSACTPAAATRGCCRRSSARRPRAAMVLFGEVLDGEEAERVGLVWRCVDDDALLDAAVALARPGRRRRRASWCVGSRRRSGGMADVDHPRRRRRPRARAAGVVDQPAGVRRAPGRAPGEITSR